MSSEVSSKESDFYLQMIQGEGLFEINTTEVVKEDEHTMYSVNGFSD